MVLHWIKLHNKRDANIFSLDTKDRSRTVHMVYADKLFWTYRTMKIVGQCLKNGIKYLQMHCWTSPKWLRCMKKTSLPPKVNLTSEDTHSLPCLLKPPVKISISANCHETFFPSVMQTTMNWTNSTSSFTGVHLKAIKWWQFPFTACLH